MLPLGSPHRSADVRRTVRHLDARLERFDRAILRADWDLFAGRSRSGSEAWQLRRARWIGDERLRAWIGAAREHAVGADDRRRLELLERVLLDTLAEQDPAIVRLRSEMQRSIVAYRPRWKGRRVGRAVVTEVVRRSARSAEREAAYRALEPLYAPLEEPLRQLVLARNARARQLGFRTFAEMRLGFEGVPPARLEAWAEAVAAAARPHVRGLREAYLERTGLSAWHPWDFARALEVRAELPDRAFPRSGMVRTILGAIDAWGFRTDRMRWRLVEHDLPAGGMTLAPDPPRDVRVMVNPRGGWLAYDVMFHELGHAVHSSLIRAPRHLLRWHENVPGFGGLHEGIGGLFESLASEAAWLASRPGISRARAERAARAHRSSGILWTAWIANWMRIEQALYADPASDPRARCRAFERRLFGYGAYRPASFVDPFFVDTPISASDYLLASLCEAQLAGAIVARFGEPAWPNRSVGPWLTRTWFAPGSRYDWIPRMRYVCGRAFGTRDFIDRARRTDPRID